MVGDRLGISSFFLQGNCLCGEEIIVSLIRRKLTSSDRSLRDSSKRKEVYESLNV